MSDRHRRLLQQFRHQPLVFVDDLDRPTLSDADHRHVAKSLRVRVGEPLTASDGAGAWRRTVLGEGPVLEPLDEIKFVEVPAVQLTVAFALVKGDRSDLVVQKATELGVDRIVPVHTVRSVVRWSTERADRNHQRHRRIAREAAMQSRRLRLPEIWPVTELSRLAERIPGLTLAEPGGPMLGSGGPDASPVSCVAVGPEGGFAPEELAGRPTVGLPGNILRSETAAIAACVLLPLNHD